MKPYIIYILAVLSVFVASAQVPSDSVSVYFRIGQSQFDGAYDDNAAAMDAFIERVRNTGDSIDHIVVRGFASPDGYFKVNKRLSQKRCDVIAEYIIKHADINRDLVKVQPEGVAWGLLRQAVAETPEVPSREKVLDVLDNVPVWIFDSDGRVVDGKKKRLMEISGGRPYRWMFKNLFPKLRKSVAIVLYLKPAVASLAPAAAVDGDAEVLPGPEQAALPEPPDAAGVSDVSDVSDESDLSDMSDVSDVSDQSDVSDSPKKLFYMAVKSNMLFDAALVPNIGAEFYLSKNLSVYGEWMHAWWSCNKHHRYYRIYGGDLGLRWWLGRKAHEKPLTGHHIGVYAGAFTFDLEFGGRGYMGGLPGGNIFDRCFINGGLEYGYSLPVSKHFNIDFSIGIGYVSGKYMEYIPDGFEHGYLWQTTKRVGWFGPTKAEISLVWLLGRGNVNSRKGGEK